MRWKDIDYDHRRIHIRAECSKCGREAMIIDAPDNLWAWLDTVPLSVRSANNGENRIGFSQAVIRTYKCKANNYVKKIGFEDSKDDIILKRTHLLVYDVMRHSFCTYASLHTNIGSEKALKIARHSKAIDVQHYQGVVTNTNDAVDYFNIYPRQLALPNATNRVLALPNSLRLLTQTPILLLEPPKDN